MNSIIWGKEQDSFIHREHLRLDTTYLIDFILRVRVV